MSVPAIALYASPPGSVCSTSHHSGHVVASHGSMDFDFNSRPSSSSASPSTVQKSVVGGLSCLFSSSSPIKHTTSSSSFPGGDGLGLLLHDRSEDLSCSYSYSSYPSIKIREDSPVSVFHGPVSCSGSDRMAVGSSRNSPPLRAPCESGDSRVGRDKLLSGFVRNAVSSCLDYNSPSLPMPGGVGLDADELPFYMDDGFVGMDLSCPRYAKEMLSSAQSRHKIFSDECVIKAFYEAEKAHRGQMRASGDPYLQHCVETAVLLAKVGANATVVAAGILHDTLDDSSMSHDYISRMFGSGVADLVRGVSKLSHLSKLARENNTANKTAEADKLHTMFLAMADARAVLIKLADRLHNMMTLDALPVIKQQRFAKETLEIFAPLANRLGIFSWKEQLENLCFKHLNPDQYRDLSSKVVKSFDEAMIASAKERLEQSLVEERISYHVLYGRHKSLYSIHSKMIKKNVSMNEIHDIHGLRLIVENEGDCYKALHAVHRLWPKVLGRCKDYITNPKFNGYRSLHTVVASEDGVPMEIQIRTKEMHLQAEFGFAAHWRYKEGDSKYSSFVLQMVEWARWVLTWHCETMGKERALSNGQGDSIHPACPFPKHSEDCPYYTHRGYDGPVFVILLENDQMSVQEFPSNSTLMDLLDRVAQRSLRWMGYRFPIKEELRPRLNREPVADSNLKLKMGDVVDLSPAIPHESLIECREEIQRMYDRGLAVSIKGGWAR